MRYLCICALQLALYVASFYYAGAGEITLGEFIIINLVVLGVMRLESWFKEAIEAPEED